jgi:hypothetical protein
LREVGSDDRAILDIAQITAHLAFITWLANGLGVALEDIGDEMIQETQR